MTLKKVIELTGYKVVTRNGDMDKEVKGVYACDLLSHAMAKVNTGDIWITIHTNLNVVAVASLTGAACVIIPEDISIEEQTIQRAIEKDVVFVTSSESSALICHRLLSLMGCHEALG